MAGENELADIQWLVKDEVQRESLAATVSAVINNLRAELARTRALLPVDIPSTRTRESRGAYGEEARSTSVCE